MKPMVCYPVIAEVKLALFRGETGELWEVLYKLHLQLFYLKSKEAEVF